MLHIALYQPEIPPNTGNIIRLSANCGAQLHLIHPLGFALSDKQLKRAGLDYHEYADIQEHADFESFMAAIGERRLFACSTKGKRFYCDPQFCDDDVFLFGPESRGLPAEVLGNCPADQVLRIPMLPNSRSLNLSNSVSVILYEAWRQLSFAQLGDALE